MATGFLAWTCLLLAAGTPDDVVHMNHRGFQIPIRIQPERKNEVKELILYLSRDQGRTWEISNISKPDQKAFDFVAAGDGMLYFSIAVRDHNGRQDPPDMYKAPVGQKIMIDTSKPTVRVSTAERKADEVQVSWEAREENPDWASLRLEWRVAGAVNSSWTPLPIQPGDRGNLKFKPGVGDEVTVRLSLRDKAGNVGEDQRTVGGSSLVSNPAERPAPGSGLMLTSNNETPNTGTDPGVIGRNTTPPVPTTGTTPGTNPGPDFPPAPTSSGGLSGESSSMPSATSNPGMSSSGPTRGALPALQIVNKRQVKLGFDVSKVGPSGLGAVEVYVSTDEGATWEKSPADPNVTLPTTPEVRGVGLQSGTVTVALPNDGVIYGFYLVVKSRAGLGEPPPAPGEAPQVRIEVDTKQPIAKLFAPQPDPNRPDSLMLAWQAEDRNLATNPVSLEWSPNGREWYFIGEAQLPNTGRYTWQVQANTPPKVHLRLTVRDTAGNVAVAQTAEPVLIDLTKPKITRVQIVVK